MIYNLCSEMEYDHRAFHGNVKRFEVKVCKFESAITKFKNITLKIDDHNVPTLEMMIDLVDDVNEWHEGGEGKERVVALHCKGGKGRTRTMICAVLIDQGLFKVLLQ